MTKQNIGCIILIRKRGDRKMSEDDKKDVVQPKICTFHNGPIVTKDKSGKEIFHERELDDGRVIVICEECIREAYMMQYGLVGKNDVVGGLMKGRLYRNVDGSKEIVHVKKKKSSEMAISLPPDYVIKNPREIYDQLSKYVIGQESYKKDLSMFGYNHIKRIQSCSNGTSISDTIHKNNMLVIGPTGSGKTLGVSCLAKILQIPFIIADVTSITEAGYVGEDVEDILRKLLAVSDGSIERAMCGIVALDEIDKLANQETGKHDVGGEGVQQALLKMIEGSGSTPITINTSNNKRKATDNDTSVEIYTNFIGWIGLGAFSGMDDVMKYNNSKSVGFRQIDDKNTSKPDQYTDDLIFNEALVKYGLLPEFVGRFAVKSFLKSLTKDDLIKIMKEPCDSILVTEKLRFSNEGIELSIDDGVVDKFADNAFKKKLGGRGLFSELYTITKNLSFDYFGSNAVSKINLVVDENGNVVSEVIKK